MCVFQATAPGLHGVASGRVGFLATRCAAIQLTDLNAVLPEKAERMPPLTQTGCREDQGHRGAPLARRRDSGYRPGLSDCGDKLS
jgi:hypothetical protein